MTKFPRLEPGFRGPAVGTIQMIIKLTALVHVDEITAVFDQDTERVVAELQESLGVEGEEGFFGPKTAKALGEDCDLDPDEIPDCMKILDTD